MGVGDTGLSLVAFLLCAFKSYPLTWEKAHEETEAHREAQGHKGQISQHRNLHFPPAASQETFGVSSKWGLEMLPQRSDPTPLEHEGLHPDQRRDFNGQNPKL